jgi:transcription elongation factor GreA
LDAERRDGAPERSNGTGRTWIGVGSRVTLAAPDGSGKFIKFTVVESRESDPAKGRISVEAPIAVAVVGREVGEEVVVPAPRGERRYLIVADS